LRKVASGLFRPLLVFLGKFVVKRHPKWAVRNIQKCWRGYTLPEWKWQGDVKMGLWETEGEVRGGWN